MKFVKHICILLTLCLILSFSYGCLYWNESDDEITYDNMPEYKSAYTEEEHLERVEDILIKHKGAFYNPIKNYTLHFLYSYLTEDPEYILVTIEHERYFKGTVESDDIWEKGEFEINETYDYSTKYSHAVIQIRNDVYYFDTMYSRKGGISNKRGFYLGKSIYEQCGYLDQKKFYCMGKQAIMTEQGLLVIYDSSDFEPGTYDFVEGIPRNEKEYEQTHETGNLKVALYESRYGYRASRVPREKFFID